MRARGLLPFALAALVMHADLVFAQQEPSGTETSPDVVDASRVFLPCTPVAAYWTGSPPSQGMPPGPDLAVVSIKTRPKDARVHLDGRFVGRARYLDGKPGYLYVEPGSYELEVRHEGYQPVRVELEARAACRYDLKHRLERSREVSTGSSEKSYGKGRPFNRVFKPRVEAEPAAVETRPAGPDTSLRADLDRTTAATADAANRPGAALRLRVTPDSASVSIDGAFVATARELRMMEGPLATTAGTHRIVVRAPGFDGAEKEIELSEGEVLELDFSLSEKRTK